MTHQKYNPVGTIEYTNCINKCSGYDTKQSGEAPVMLEFWEMQSTPSLPSLLGSLWPEMVGPNRVLSMGQIELCPNK